MNVTGHDSNFALTWLNDTWAVRSDESSLILRFHDRFNLDHIKCRNSLGDADNEVHLGFDSFEDGIGSKRRRDVDD